MKKTVPELEIALQKVHELRGEHTDDLASLSHHIVADDFSVGHLVFVCVFVQ